MSSKTKKKSSANKKKKTAPFLKLTDAKGVYTSSKSGQPVLTRGSALDRYAEWIYLFLAFFIPFILMFAAFKVMGVSPFGNNMILATDAWHQYYPFLVDYHDKLQHGGSLLWTWKSGGGSNYVALMSYYLASPLNFFSVLVPADKLREFLYIITCVKIGLAGLFYALFLRLTFKRRDASIAAFGIMYALCAFIMGYYWNVIWLDTIALLPLVIAGTVALLRDGKFRLYIIALGLSILANYYIGLFTCIFVFFVSLGYCIVEFKGWKNLIFRFVKMAWCSLLGIMLSAVLTLPTYFALKYTFSSENTFPKAFSVNIGSTANFAGVLEGMGKTISNSVAFVEPTAKEGLPNIYCGVFIIFLALLFFFCSKIKLRERIFCGVLQVFFILSFIIRQLDYVWHGFHFPNMLPHRFSFLYSFVLIYMAFRVFMYIDDIKLASVFGGIAAFTLYIAVAYTYFKATNTAKVTEILSSVNEKYLKITNPAMVFLYIGILFVASILVFSFAKNIKAKYNPTIVMIVGGVIILAAALLLIPVFDKKIAVTPVVLSIYLGGFLAVWVLMYSLRNQVSHTVTGVGFAVVGLAIAILIFKSGPLINAIIDRPQTGSATPAKVPTENSLYIVLGIIVLLMAAASAFLIIYQKINVDHQMTKVVLSVILLLLALTEGFFSTAAGVKKVGVTDAASYPAGGNDTLSCVAHVNELEKDNIDLPRTEVNKYWSLNDNALIGADGISMFSSMVNSDVTVFMERFGICGWKESNRYTYQESSPFTNLMLNVKYLISPYGNYLDSTHNDLIYQHGNVTLTENKDYLPQGFMVNKELADFDIETANINPMENQNEMFRKATGLSGDLYNYLASDSQSAANQTSTITPASFGYFSYSSSMGNESYDINYTADRSGVATAYLSTATENVSIRVNGSERIGYYIKRPFIMMIGDVAEGDVITLHVTMKDSSSGSITAYCSMFNEELFRLGHDKLAQSTLEATKVTDTCIEGDITAKNDGLFYTSISYSPGWKAYVDGKEVEITPVGKAMVAFPLSEGKHTVSLRYMPEGFVPGLIITLLALLIYILMIIFVNPLSKEKLFALKSRVFKRKALAAGTAVVKTGQANDDRTVTADDTTPSDDDKTVTADDEKRVIADDTTDDNAST